MMNHTQIKHIDPTEGRNCEKCNLTLDYKKVVLEKASLVCMVHIDGVLCEKCVITLEIAYPNQLRPRAKVLSAV